MKLKITDHETTQQEQLKKAYGELKEFFAEREFWKLTKSKGDAVKVVDEGIDFCKAFQKAYGFDIDYNVTNFRTNETGYYNMFNARLKGFFLENDTMYAELTIAGMMIYLGCFCENLGLDFEELVKANDDKNDSRGVGKKLYVDEEDRVNLDKILDDLDFYTCKMSMKYLKNIIDKIED